MILRGDVRERMDYGEFLLSRSQWNGASGFKPLWMPDFLLWLASCDELVRLPGESAGADREVSEARRLGIPVVFG